MDRRDFLKAVGIAGISTLSGKNLQAQSILEEDEFMGALIDTTRCIGCRKCEEACAKEHNLPVPDLNENVFDLIRKTSTISWTVVNRFKTDKGDVFVKRQCMHCNQPACAAACLTKAMVKREEGPVIWRESKCMGCRFCMVSCPFEMPKFEYDSPMPSIQKCSLCWERLKEGNIPACVEACPVGAIVYGKRRDIIEEAKAQIYKEPGKYIPQIYGEHEVGGTSWLYISAVPLEQLGFRTDLGTTPYPDFTKEFLYGVPVVLILWPTILLAISNATKKEEE